ncbi:MAG: RCC1 domain-containing protein [Sedimentisphaerales bacterium]
MSCDGARRRQPDSSPQLHWVPCFPRFKLNFVLLLFYPLWGAGATPPEGNNFIAIAAGGGFSLALKSDHSIVGWGDDTYGQIDVPAGNNFIAVAGAQYHSLALRACQFNLAGDLNNDCRVDLDDFAIFAGNWLVDCYADPNNPSCVPK